MLLTFWLYLSPSILHYKFRLVIGANALAARCRTFHPGHPDTPAEAAKYAPRSLARRYRQLSNEIHVLNAALQRLIQTTAPALVEAFGVGPDTAAALLSAAGGNPDRLNSEAAFASLCGVSPVPTSPCKTTGIGSTAGTIARLMQRYIA